jgi:hypothetical protein
LRRTWRTIRIAFTASFSPTSPARIGVISAIAFFAEIFGSGALVPPVPGSTFGALLASPPPPPVFGPSVPCMNGIISGSAPGASELALPSMSASPPPPCRPRVVRASEAPLPPPEAGGPSNDSSSE